MIDAYFIIYFKDLGYSFIQISTLFAAYFITAFLLEVPTGAFADHFGRKTAVILGFALAGTAVSVIPVSTNFTVSLLLWVLAGIGVTFISGAEEAWVVSNLNKAKRPDLIEQYFMKSLALVSFGAIAAPLLGSFLVKFFSIKLLWYVFGGGFLASSLIVTLFAEEFSPPRKVLVKSYVGMMNTIKRGGLFVLSNKVVLLLIVGNCFIALMGLGYVGHQPLLVSLGMDKVGLGVFSSVLAILSTLTYFSARFFKKLKVPFVMMFIAGGQALVLFCFLFLSSNAFLLASGMLILTEVLKRLKEPLFQPYFHKFIPEQSRATVTSINNMSTSLVFATGTIVAGGLMEVFDVQAVIAFGGFFGIFAIATYSLIREPVEVNISAKKRKSY
jgi:DHA3 family tetracycline resistance protein-like MFS transporter